MSGNDSFTKILLHLDGLDGSTAFPDVNAGGSAHIWTAGGNAQIDTAQSEFGGASLLCGGAGDYITTPDSPDFTLGSGDWTVDCWFQVNDAGGTQVQFAGQCDSAVTNTSTSFLCARLNTNVMYGACYNGTTLNQIVGTTQFTNALNTGWHHYALVRTGNTLKMFIDGVQEGVPATLSGAVNDTANALSVGRWGEVVALTWNGWIDEFRLSVGIARWTANFTPPAAPYSLDSPASGILGLASAEW